MISRLWVVPLGFVPRNNHTSAQGMAEEIEAEKCRCRIFIKTKRLNVNRMDNNIIMMLPMTRRRCCTNGAYHASIISKLKCPFRKTSTTRISNSTWKLCDVGRDVNDCPMPVFHTLAIFYVRSWLARLRASSASATMLRTISPAGKISRINPVVCPLKGTIS